MNEEDALRDVALAKENLALALEKLRLIRGEPETEPCRFCTEGESLLGGGKCSECDGTGQVKKRFPLIVTKLQWGNDELIQRSLWKPSVKWVAVRPCDDECQGKTYLGIALGDMALGMYANIEADGTLKVNRGHYNPAMYVPDLHRVVFGCGSWWRAIKTPEDLRQISDADIDNVWYVRALRELTESTQAPGEEGADATTLAAA